MSNVECYKLPVASTCCLLPFDMLLRHVAGVDGALEIWNCPYSVCCEEALR